MSTKKNLFQFLCKVIQLSPVLSYSRNIGIIWRMSTRNSQAGVLPCNLHFRDLFEEQKKSRKGYSSEKIKVNICYVAHGTFFRILLTFGRCVHNVLISFTRIFVRGLEVDSLAVKLPRLHNSKVSRCCYSLEIYSFTISYSSFLINLTAGKLTNTKNISSQLLHGLADHRSDISRIK